MKKTFNQIHAWAQRHEGNLAAAKYGLPLYPQPPLCENCKHAVPLYERMVYRITSDGDIADGDERVSSAFRWCKSHSAIVEYCSVCTRHPAFEKADRKRKRETS